MVGAVRSNWPLRWSGHRCFPIFRVPLSVLIAVSFDDQERDTKEQRRMPLFEEGGLYMYIARPLSCMPSRLYVCHYDYNDDGDDGGDDDDDDDDDDHDDDHDGDDNDADDDYYEKADGDDDVLPLAHFPEI